MSYTQYTTNYFRTLNLENQKTWKSHIFLIIIINYTTLHKYLVASFNLNLPSNIKLQGTKNTTKFYLEFNWDIIFFCGDKNWYISNKMTFNNLMIP